MSVKVDRQRAGRYSAILFFLLIFTSQAAGAQNIISATPADYLGKLRNLRAGDTLLLEPGTYDDPSDAPGLPFFNIHGEPDKPIVVTGPDSGPRPVILGRSTHNTVRFDNASYIVVKNIEIDGRDRGGDGIKAQGVAHHITLENILIRGVGDVRSTNGISTNGAPTWNWVIRRNIIVRAGTGMYLGNSDGNEPFIAGIIENNLILDTIGYNTQIKHQNVRPTISGMPTGDSTTIIRHNVFSKANNSSLSVARPNLLVGHFPPSGPGANDVYQIYGNFFYQNPSGDALFQGEGNVALYNNLFFNTVGDAIHIQPHNDVPKMIRVFNNTIVSTGLGVKVTGGSTSFEQIVTGNAVFAAEPIRATTQLDNITDAFPSASNYLTNPAGRPEDGTLDLFPNPGKLVRTAIDTSSFNTFLAWDRDFNGVSRTGIFRGAYAGEGQNPGWLPKLEIKPAMSSSVRPSAPTNLIVQ
jgi:hypothetical protein